LIENIEAFGIIKKYTKFICLNALNLISLSVPHQKKFILVFTHYLHRYIAAKVLAGKQSYTTSINSIIIMAFNASDDSQTNTIILFTAHSTVFPRLTHGLT
jgi:hypothetical protein